MKLVAVDCNYVENEFAASYLLVHQGRGWFIECNTNHAIPLLKEAAMREGLSPEMIDGLIITHVHLDHAGGSGLFLREFPNAQLYAHPRAARHAVDPSRLIASATQVYGEAFMEKLYGKILPCDPNRVKVLEDGDEVDWTAAGVTLKTRHLRGHANHHLCVIEPLTRTLFSGDSFGVSYPKINQKRGVVALPSTSPTDFDADAAIASVEWILDQDLLQVGPTHFGFLKGAEIRVAGMQLIDELRFSAALLKKIQKENLTEEQVVEHIHDWTIQYFASKGIHLDSDDLKLLKLDMKVNAQGLVFAAGKKS